MESLCFSCQDAWCFMNPSYLMHAHIHSVGIYVHPSNKQFCALQSRRQLGHVIHTLNIIEIEVCNVLAQWSRCAAYGLSPPVDIQSTLLKIGSLEFGSHSISHLLCGFSGGIILVSINVLLNLWHVFLIDHGWRLFCLLCVLGALLVILAGFFHFLMFILLLSWVLVLSFRFGWRSCCWFRHWCLAQRRFGCLCWFCFGLLFLGTCHLRCLLCFLCFLWGLGFIMPPIVITIPVIPWCFPIILFPFLTWIPPPSLRLIKPPILIILHLWLASFLTWFCVFSFPLVGFLLSLPSTPTPSPTLSPTPATALGLRWFQSQLVIPCDIRLRRLCLAKKT